VSLALREGPVAERAEPQSQLVAERMGDVQVSVLLRENRSSDNEDADAVSSVDESNDDETKGVLSREIGIVV
jgi:hypothetical protein